MSRLLGMDPVQIRQLARSLEAAAEDLERLGQEVTGKVSVTPWLGGDADAFRADWTGRHRPSLLDIAAHLRRAAFTADDNFQAQERTSTAQPDVPSRAPAGSPTPDWSTADAAAQRDGGGNDDDWIADGLGWVAGGVDWITDTTRDGGGRILEHAEQGYGNIARSFDALAGDARHTYALMDGMLSGAPPTLMELAASSALLSAGAADFSATAGSFGQFDPRLLDDGTPWASEPIQVGVSTDGMGPATSGHRPSVLPTDLAAIALNTGHAYADGGTSSSPDGAVRITRVLDDDGPSYIVNIPGTQSWSLLSSGTGADLTGNLVTASGQLSTATSSVALAMARAGIEPDAPVMLSGHSQGGMAAAALASNPSFLDSFNVTNVMTFGSPIDTAAIPSSVEVIAFEHQDDIVPRLDLGGLDVEGNVPTSSGTRVTLRNPDGGNWADVVPNHDFNNYAASIARSEDVPAGAPARYAAQPSTAQFLTDSPEQVESFVVPVERRFN